MKRKFFKGSWLVTILLILLLLSVGSAGAEDPQPNDPLPEAPEVKPEEPIEWVKPMTMAITTSSGVFPSSINTTLGPGEALTLDKYATLPETPPKLDLVLMVDLSGSYRDDLPTIKSKAENIFDGVRSFVADSNFGLTSFIDFPFDAWGEPWDYAYMLNQDLTSDKTTWISAINAMGASGGYDTPESQYEALYQAATGAGKSVYDYTIPAGQDPSWRDGVTHVIAITTDAPFHNTGDGGGPFPYPGATASETVTALNAASIKVIAIKAPGASTQMDDIAAATGGAVASTGSTSAEIVEAIVGSLDEFTFTVTPVPVGCDPLIFAFSPASYSDVSGGDTVVFSETITVPGDPGVESVTCQVEFQADGAVFGTQDIFIQINRPPVADANGPYSVQEDLTINLDGTGSSDPDGDVLTFEWDLDNDGIFETPGATPAFSRPDPGIYPVTLRVCDAFTCDTDTSEVFVTIEPGMFPSEVTAYLIAGESFTEDKIVNVPPRPPKADVVFAFDLTGSMGDIISTAKSRAGDIMSQLNAISGVEIQFGLMSYMDYPNSYDCSGYSADYGYAFAGDYAYNLDHSITNDTTQIALDINALSLGWGGDGPQDYTRIFYESYADSSVGWRAGAKKILLNFGDDVPHDDNLEEGLYGGTWSTGCDPGRDEIAGTSDDLDLQTVLAEMDTAGVTLLESHTNSWTSDYWQYWTGLTGGDVFITSSSTLVDDIVGSITSTLESGLVSGLHLEGSPGFEDWVSSEFKDVDPGQIGVSVPFEAVFTVPAGTEPGEYNFTVFAVDEDGVIYGEQSVTIHVLPPSTITNSGLCTFDVLPDVEGDQFRLIFTPDMQLWPQYKLPASNPGQFYYNVFFAGDGPVNLDISIPEPFVGQGANPVHVYQGRTVNVFDGTTCFVPDYESEIFAGTLDELPSDLPGGFLYVAIHLDYGLKGTTGYVPNFNNDAMNADETEVLIPNFSDYTFSVSGSQTDSQVIQNTNDFKKIPGFGGLVTDGVNPVAGATVEIYLNGELLTTETTDIDGWYMHVYKHTGKPAEFSVMVDGEEITGVLKANKFVEASFVLSP